MKFETGELVSLKSGGPVMTIEGRPSVTSENYRCQWFAGKKLEKGVFPPDSLKRVDAEGNDVEKK